MAMDLVRRLALEGLLTDAQVAAVVARRAAFGEPIPVVLCALEIASPAAVVALFDRMGFAPALRLTPAPFARTLPRGMLRALWALPIGESPLGVVVAMVDPTDGHALRELEYHLRKPIDPRWANLEELGRVLLELDPPSEPSPQRTHRAPAPPPPPPGTEHLAAHPAMPAPPAEVLAFAARPRRRRLTPAYGEASMALLEGAVPSVGTIDHRPEAARVLRLGPVAGAIGAFEAPAVALEVPPTSPRDSEAPIPLRRRAPLPPRPAAAAVPREALHALTELRAATDRDSSARIAVRGLLAVAERAAFFVVKRGVVQGWEGATLEGIGAAGLSREALRNLWIPVTSPSVFRRVSEAGALFTGALSDSTADSILAAALGGRPAQVLLAPITVRTHLVGFLYADGFAEPRAASQRAEALVAAMAEALERWLVSGRGSR
jgi:hypothetical protein